MGISAVLSRDRRASATETRGRWTVRRYLVMIAITALVALLVGSWYGFSWAAGRDRSAALGQLKFETARSAEAVSSALSLGQSTVNDLASQPGLDRVFGAKPGACTLTAGGVGPFPKVRLDIVAADGQVGCSSSKEQEVFKASVHKGSKWLNAAMNATSAIAVWDARDAATGQSAVVVTTAVKSSDGKPVGAIALFMFVPPTAAALAHDYSGSQQATFTVVDGSTGSVLSTSLAGTKGTAAIGQQFPHRAAGEWDGPAGARSLFSSHVVPNGRWRIFAEVPTSQVFASAHGALMRAGLIGLAAIALLFAALVILNRRVAGPLRAVTSAVLAAGRDPGATRITPTGTAELVTLARQVNTMLDVRAGFEAQLRHQAAHDPLTGLPNAGLLRDRLEQALNGPANGYQVTVVSLGVDRFRTLNDALGPDAADRILVELAERLSAAMGPGEFLARYGGDQFVVVSEASSGAEEAVQLGARLRSCLDEPFHPSTDPIAVSASVGISITEGHEVAPTAPQLLREADSAMHEAKASGRGWVLSDQTQLERATHYLDTEHALRQALENGELVVYYQPLLDIATGKLAGAEALVRWQHPTRGLVPPMEFIPVAEETGQINDIGALVLTEACAEAARWSASGHPLTVSVNVAVGQLDDPSFVVSVQRALAGAGLPPSRLCLEVTESAMMRASGAETSALEALRSLGVRLAIDDFGTGYSSLSYLHELPVDELKIDRSFISRIATGNRDAHLVEAIMGMAHALGLEVVAEGVETAEQLEFLADLGCQEAQGYLFSPPVPADAFRAQLTRRSSPTAAPMSAPITVARR